MNDYWLKLSKLNKEIEKDISKIKTNSTQTKKEQQYKFEELKEQIFKKSKELKQLKENVQTKLDSLIMNLDDYKSTLSEDDQNGTSISGK